MDTALARRAVLSLGGILLLVLAAACGPGGEAPQPSEETELDDLPSIGGDGSTDFVSDVAGIGGGYQRGLAAGAVDDAAAPNAAGSDSAERAIAEADIIQLDGDTLYALSSYAGLTVIDMSDPADLRVLGNYRTAATPFEMYLRDGVAYVMFNGYYSYVLDEAAGVSTWQSTSRLQALDVSDPAAIEVLGDLDVPGDISDSRMVGDIIYVATYQSGYCWGCDEVASTRVASFDVGDAASFVKVDELRFDDDDHWGGARSISVNMQRMYVAGPSWDWDDTQPSSIIQVVDISDAGGRLGLGAEVPVAGQITNRWQMDEQGGVLRVLSQRGNWRSTAPPVLETFDIVSSGELSPLGQLELTLPRAEDLQSVRFDGDRAYAITFEQTDPLFTLDLSDPAQPVQRGELQIPGWVYHMEPRGDRVYGLGFDQGNAEGGMHVSIFDVSDLDNPTMLDRVNFGGAWANTVEDQDRIHKAFNLMLDQGLIFVPFAGGEYDESTCRYSYQSGIQIIDVDGDDLTRRGVAPQIGTARRSLLHRGSLFGISDNAVQAFDISDRDAPKAIDEIEVARNIESLHLVDHRLLRFGQDWWTGRTLIDFTSPEDANNAEPLGELDLSLLYDEEQTQCDQGEGYWGGQVLVHGDTAYVPRYRYYWGNNRDEQQLSVHIIDLSGDAPALIGTVDVDPAGGDEYFGNLLVTDSALLVGRTRGYYHYDPHDGSRADQVPRYFYDVYDLADAHAPTFTRRFEVPDTAAGYGWGYGPVGCGLDMGWGFWYGGASTSAIVRGDILVSQHAEPLGDDPTRVRYYMDRLDVSDPEAPRMLERVNIPGQVIDYRPDTRLVVTVEDRVRVVDAGSPDDCNWRGARVYYDYQMYEQSGEVRCEVYDRLVNVLRLEGEVARRLSQVNLDEEFNSLSVGVSDSRIFALLAERRKSDGIEPVPVETRVDSFGIGGDGRLRRLEPVSLGSSSQGYWWTQMQARGAHAFIAQDNEMLVIDTSDVAKPTLVRHDMPGYYCASLEIDTQRAYCAMGVQGVLSFEL